MMTTGNITYSSSYVEDLHEQLRNIRDAERARCAEIARRRAEHEPSPEARQACDDIAGEIEA